MTSLLSGISRFSGGLYYSVRALSKELQEAGVSTRVVSTDYRLTLEDRNAWDPLPLVIGHCPMRNGLRYSPGLESCLNAIPFKVLHQHGIWQYPSSVAGRWSVRNPSCVKVISPRGMLDEWALQRSGWKKKIALRFYERQNLLSASCFHALAPTEALAIRRMGIKSPICVIPNGFDIPTIPDENSVVHEKEVKTLLFLGRVNAKKGLLELMEAWNRIRGNPRRYPWQLAIVGWDDGCFKHHLQELAKELGVKHLECTATEYLERVRNNDGIKGAIFFVDEAFGKSKQEILSTSDAFVLPSFSEGMPMSILEAWAYKLPVILTPQCNIGESQNSKSYLEVFPEVESIANGITKLMEMTDFERHELGLAGFRRVADEFKWSNIANEFITVYEWLLNRQLSQPKSIYS